MIDRQHIERILRMNGLTETAADEEIKALLLSAKWKQDDVETALTVLRENKETHEERVETSHNIFRSDTRLQPESIQSLLGIDVGITSDEIENIRSARQHISIAQAATILFFAMMFALVCMFAFMWYHQMGIFFSIS